MKKCPFCAEMIAIQAKKCSFCGEKMPGNDWRRLATVLTAAPVEIPKRLLFGSIGLCASQAAIYAAASYYGKFPSELHALLGWEVRFFAIFLAIFLLVFFLASRKWPSIMNLDKSGSIESVDEIRCDNFLFRWIREKVFQLDRAIFDHKGSADSGYQPTRFSLIVPFWFAVLANVPHFFRSLVFCGELDDPNRCVMTFLFILFFNTLLCSKNILFLPGWIRQFFYPIFITACSLGVFLLIFSVCWWLCSYAWVVLLIVGALTSRGGSSGVTSPVSSSANEESPTVQEMTIYKDGSFLPTTLTREGGFGDWHGDDGHTYTEDMEGNLHQK